MSDRDARQHQQGYRVCPVAGVGEGHVAEDFLPSSSAASATSRLVGRSSMVGSSTLRVVVQAGLIGVSCGVVDRSVGSDYGGVVMPAIGGGELFRLTLKYVLCGCL